MRARGVASLLFSGLLAAAACSFGGYGKKPRVAVADGDPIVQMESPAKFPSLTAPRLVPAAARTDPSWGNEPVAGVFLSEIPRLYPIGLLDSYEVVNDEDAGVPYVVTRCALTDLVAAWERRAAGRTLTFENSGALWRDMLVLRDRETETWWTPSTGRALAGPLAGQVLSPLPAPVARARDWKETYPEALWLDTGDLSAIPLTLRLYGVSSWQGVSGQKTTDARFKPKTQLLAVSVDEEALAFTAEEIRKRKTATAAVGGASLSIEWDGSLRTPRAWIGEGASRREWPVLPMYWFALTRHFTQVQTLRASVSATPARD